MHSKIIISGANGKMGRALIDAIGQHNEAELVGAVIRTGDSTTGQGAAGPILGIDTKITVSPSLSEVLKDADANVFIDFTRPEATLSYLPICIEHQIPLVIGTTGFSQSQKEAIQKASELVPIVLSPNFSIGINLTFALVGLAARTLRTGYDIEIVEAHHRHKVDAPSGTALRIGEVIAENKHKNLADIAVYSREGYTGTRNPDAIGFATIRGGDIVGDHTAIFAGDGERVEITHKASSRLTFANGAIHAALWLTTKPNGLYSMQDVLGIHHLG